MIVLILSGVTALLTAVMMWGLAHKKRWAWWVSLANQGNWAAFAILTHGYLMLPLTAWLTYTAIKGLRNWK